MLVLTASDAIELDEMEDCDDSVDEPVLISLSVTELDLTGCRGCRESHLELEGIIVAWSFVVLLVLPELDGFKEPASSFAVAVELIAVILLSAIPKK